MVSWAQPDADPLRDIMHAIRNGWLPNGMAHHIFNGSEIEASGFGILNAQGEFIHLPDEEGVYHITELAYGPARSD